MVRANLYSVPWLDDAVGSVRENTYPIALIAP